MNANQLRLGNLVNHKSFGVVPICSINKDAVMVTYKENNYWDDICYVEPILLTEKWVKEIGFIRQGKRNFWVKDNINVIFHGVITVEYVHQLQNLYFFHNQKELTYNGN